MFCLCSYTDWGLWNQKCTNRHFSQNETAGMEKNFVNRKPSLLHFWGSPVLFEHIMSCSRVGPLETSIPLSSGEWFCPTCWSVRAQHLQIKVENTGIWCLPLKKKLQPLFLHCRVQHFYILVLFHAIKSFLAGFLTARLETNASEHQRLKNPINWSICL